MYAQFFGNYLLNKRAVTAEQLTQAIEEQHIRHIKLGILAINAGLMTTEQVDSILLRQAEENRNFGELAIEEGFLTREQIESLLNEQIPVYLLIGERLVENGVLTEAELEQYVVSYQEENALSQPGDSDTIQQDLQTLLQNLFILAEDNIPEHFFQYISLLYSNLIRLIGDDFMTLNPTLITEYVTNRCCGQIINGEISLTSYLDMEEDAAIAFASRYAETEFAEYDAYVEAAMNDFLNLQNGLFNVNISNERSIELILNPAVVLDNTMVSSTSKILLLPIIYPFGTLNFFFKI
ncbi:MAG: chemotaxis protein CheX [Lachnospiraceae bacterium]|nr:chemotaxis protein CheX [Lachnospiraceae bacterium]